ncbi:MAG: type II toxin-antitoxin system VapC family toxin [Alphaproteobacteria bacterium]|nr:type II toxin-antitoxin system VapC family toxin [Alphaproteobacteria bacterium]
MSYLLDTNVLSEARKGARCDPAVAAWFGRQAKAQIWTSAIVIGEIRRGIQRMRGRDGAQALVLERWLAQVKAELLGRILPVDERVAEVWGALDAAEPLPTADGLLAATAKVHRLTVVTRDLADIGRTGVPTLNPFVPA